MIEHGLRAEGVDVRHVVRDDARTGLFVKWRAGEERGVAYYRAGRRPPASAAWTCPKRRSTGSASSTSPGSRWRSPRRAAPSSSTSPAAQGAGAIVLFDPNFRPALPDTPRGAPNGSVRCCRTSTGT